jgi:hypothetical protein
MVLQNVNLSADTFTLALMGNYVKNTPLTDLLSATNWSEVSAYEVSGNNYSSVTLSGLDIINSNGVYWDGDNLSWSNVSVEVYGCCFYRSSDGLIVGFMEFSNTPIIAVNGLFSIIWNDGGIMQFVSRS